MTFHKSFVVSSVNYHKLLLEEANRKHDVPLNLPPQLNPATDEHRPVYCDELGRMMQEPERHFAFAPLHGPPPKVATPGEPAPAKSAPPSAEPSLASDAKPFVCSVCNKAFRLKLSAQQHVEGNHRGEAGAHVIEAGAPAKVQTVASAKGASRGLAALPNPLLQLMADVDTPAVEGVSLAPLEAPVVFTPPTEAEIDTLLLECWDEVGRAVAGTEYRAASSYIVGNTSAEQAAKDGEHATLSITASAASTSLAGATGSANPLAARLARDAPSTSGFTSPFVNAANIDAAMPKTHTSARLERKFKCEHCGKAYRLLDAVLNHYQMAHESEPTPEVLARFKSLDNPFDKTLSAAAEDAACASKAAAESDAAVRGDGFAAAPIPEVELCAHIRAASNVTLVGRVRELRHGYVQAEPVTQLLVQVDDDGDEPGSSAWSELVTVRCFGENFSARLKANAEDGTLVALTGMLKLNHHVDTDSGESYPYPYVRVLEPFGTITVLAA